jgi:hypothetical protein
MFSKEFEFEVVLILIYNILTRTKLASRRSSPDGASFEACIMSPPSMNLTLAYCIVTAVRMCRWMDETGWLNRVDKQMAILLRRVDGRGSWMHGGSNTQAGSE